MINLIPASRTALVIDGETLLVVRTKMGVRGPTSRTIARLDDFLTAPVDTLRGRLRGETRDTSSELVLVLPASWCASRPVPIDAKSWKHASEARDELIEAYFPFDASDALAGVLDLSNETEEGPSGAMFVAPKRDAEPWRERVAQVFGRPVDETIASTMALPALGLQSRERVTIVEPGTRPLATTLSWGRPMEVAEPFDEQAVSGELFTLGDASAPGAQKLSMEALGAAAGRLPFVPGVKYRALGLESGAKLDRRVPLVASLALIAIIAFALASFVTDARYESAIASIDARMDDRSDELAEVQRLRARTREIASTIENVNDVTNDWSSVLPDLASAFETVGDEGFVHRVELTPARLVISGEAPESLAVLEALEQTEAFGSARQSGSLTQTPRELETFNVEARRARADEGRSER